MLAGHSRLEHFPITLFTSVMGLGGYTLATKAAGMPALTLLMTVVSTLVLLLVGMTYLLKFMRYPNAVKHEFNHPVRHAFFPAISIGLLIMAEVYFSFSPILSKVMGCGCIHAVFIHHSYFDCMDVSRKPQRLNDYPCLVHPCGRQCDCTDFGHPPRVSRVALVLLKLWFVFLGGIANHYHVPHDFSRTHPN